MKKTSILLALFCGLLYVTLSSNGAGPAASGTGDRTVTGCGGSGCHTSGTFSISGVVLMDAAGTTTMSSYTPGGSYRILVGAGTTMLPKYGFQVKATDAMGSSGTMTAPAGTHITPVSGVSICEHTSPLTPVTPGIDSISIPWIAPAAGHGTVTFNAAINSVNGTGSTAGDSYIVMSSTVTESTSSTPPITGTPAVCVGGTTTMMHATPGGTWTSSTPANGTIGASNGVVGGIAAGTTTISYNTGTATVTQVVTVFAVPATTITGASSVCVGRITTLTASPVLGTWSSSTPAKGTVSSTGVVAGIATGTTTIKYKVTNICGVTDSATKVVTIVAFSPSCVLAVNNVTTEEFHIYPNPNRGAFTLDLASPLNGDAYVVVTNATGAKVKDFKVQANNKVDVVLNQPPGVYFIAATTLTQRYFVKVVVE